MQSETGEIRKFRNAFEAQSAGFNIPLSESEAAELHVLEKQERLSLLVTNRHERRRQKALERKKSSLCTRL